MRTSFSTLACPNWTLEQILTEAGELGYDGIDFRGLGTQLDVTRLPELTDKLSRSAGALRESGVSVSGISTGIRLYDPDHHEKHLEEARRTIKLARELDAPFLRVFGGGEHHPELDRANAVEVASTFMEEILDLPDADSVTWVIETHDIWVRAADLSVLLESVPARNVGLAWDIAHTIRLASESAEETVKALGDRIAYVHVKDALFEPEHRLAMSDGWRYVLPGTGAVPLAHALSLLSERGYDGWVCFEHEKRWQAALEEPHTALSAFIEWFSGLDIERN